MEKKEKRMVTMEEVKAALQKVMDSCKNQYALSYANYGLSITDEYEMKVQCLYVLSNLVYWRGEEAREVKEVLKAAGAGNFKK